VKNIAIVMVVAAALVGCSKESSKTEGAAASASTPIASATAPASAATPAPSDSTPAAAASGDPPTEEQYEQKAATTITSSTLKAQLDQLDKEVGN
jgi:3-oxoacyl-ACP reductase-like protein